MLRHLCTALLNVSLTIALFVSLNLRASNSIFDVTLEPLDPWVPAINQQERSSLAYSSKNNLPTAQGTLGEETTLADFVQEVLEQYYEESYALLPKCPDGQSLRDCFSGYLQDELNSTDSIYSLRSLGNATNKSIPWWLRTMLGDASNEAGGMSGLFGGWHKMSTNNPPYQMCAIEKIGIKQWTKMACRINELPGSGTKCVQAVPPPPEDTPKFVFLRDPLERFLSAFLDKCYRSPIERNCRPAELFLDNPGPALKRSKRRFFEAYVDSFPLNWDLHFYPQSFHCDGLYRNMQNYSFVGKMGPSFYRDLSRLGETFIPQWDDNSRIRFQTVLDSTFGISRRNLTTHTNVGVETRASSKWGEYYSARTVRKLLEYYSIDYLLLNLTVPEWAQKMLWEDEQERRLRRSAKRRDDAKMSLVLSSTSNGQ